MTPRLESLRRRLSILAILAAGSAVAAAQYVTPHIVSSAAVTSTTIGSMTFVNHGLVGVGRLSASRVDPFGDTLGSVSGLQITNWTRDRDGRYRGTFHILPDRGYNSGAFYSNYAARINQVDFIFTPDEGAAAIGGATDLDKVRAQRQIVFPTPVTGVELQYDDPVTHRTSFTTGLDPGAGIGTLFGRPVPFVTSYTGPRSPDAASPTTYSGINKLAVDAEALALRPDGSGYVGDEYGPYVYYFDRTKKIVGMIVPPAAILPHRPAGTLNFSSALPPINGRRNNQGFEGVALSPDGSRLFLLLQTAVVQDSNPAVNDYLARHTRLLVYDVRTTPTPGMPVAEYALSLPTYTNARDTAVHRTAGQSEIAALDNTRLLVLARDANGLGSAIDEPGVFKAVLLVDIGVGAPTNFAADSARNAEGGRITTAPGVLDPAITPVSWVDVVNLLNVAQLQRFDIVLESSTGPGDASRPTRAVSKLTLGEKWEGLSLAPANDAARPNDYFLFVANDNDFLTSDGRMFGPDGTFVKYNGFKGYPSGDGVNRIPPPIDSPNNENDTVFLAYRVTIVTSTPVRAGQR
jgi:hypothetical protein